MVILNQNDLRMKKWCRNDRDENPPKMTYFLPNDQGMTHFSHSDVIPSFEDEDEWDEVDQFPYRERCRKKKLKKKLTNVSFAFTHTYTPVKTNIFRFFPQSYMENFEKCAKTQKQKNNMLSHVTCGC